MNERKNPAPDGQGQERECLVSRFGNTEVIQTKDRIKIRVRRQENERMDTPGAGGRAGA